MPLLNRCIAWVASIILLSFSSFTFAYSSPYATEEEYQSGYSYEPSSSYQEYSYEEPKRMAYHDRARYERYYEQDYEPNYYYYEERPRARRRAYVRARREYEDESRYYSYRSSRGYSDRMPASIRSAGEKVIVINPRVHAWGAYTADGTLVRSGLATSGGNWCPDVRRPCRTRVGSFRIFSLGSASCYSRRYPLRTGGGAPMPYCMFFNKNQGLHGSNELREANVSHGCVRISVPDAAWLRYNFARVGTRVVVQPY